MSPSEILHWVKTRTPDQLDIWHEQTMGYRYSQEDPTVRGTIAHYHAIAEMYCLHEYGGEGIEHGIMLELIAVDLKRHEQELQMFTAEMTILKEHEVNDVANLMTGSVYLKMTHGRNSTDEELDDWGFDGPWIGPLKWVHFTYGTLGSIGFVDGEEISPASKAIAIKDDLLMYDGKYYGDWEVQIHEPR